MEATRWSHSILYACDRSHMDVVFETCIGDWAWPPAEYRAVDPEPSPVGRKRTKKSAVFIWPVHAPCLRSGSQMHGRHIKIRFDQNLQSGVPPAAEFRAKNQTNTGGATCDCTLLSSLFFFRWLLCFRILRWSLVNGLIIARLLWHMRLRGHNAG